MIPRPPSVGRVKSLACGGRRQSPGSWYYGPSLSGVWSLSSLASLGTNVCRSVSSAKIASLPISATESMVDRTAPLGWRSRVEGGIEIGGLGLTPRRGLCMMYMQRMSFAAAGGRQWQWPGQGRKSQVSHGLHHFGIPFTGSADAIGAPFGPEPEAIASNKPNWRGLR